MTDTPLPSGEQEARAKWDLLLADLEYRQDQMRQSRQQIEATGQDMRFKPWQVAFAGMTAGAALFAAGAAFVKLLGG